MKVKWFLFSVIALLAGCRPVVPAQYSFVEGFAQGTTYHITYENRKQVDYSADISRILDDFDQSLSIYIPGSIILRINKNEHIKPDAHFTRVFNKAMEVSDASGGAFDITVGPLVNAWGFGNREGMHPEQVTIDSLLTLVGYKKVKLADGYIVKENPGIQLDVNAIAQGYSVDVVSEFFQEHGVRNYLVEIGGEVRTKGKNPDGKLWKVGIDKPVDGNIMPGTNLQAILQMDNRAMATSGDYRKFYIENGRKYAHHIDPATGYPARQNLLCATVIAKDCITADAWGTAFMVSGLEKSRKWLSERKDLEAYMVYTDELGNYQVWYTPGLKKMLLEEE